MPCQKYNIHHFNVLLTFLEKENLIRSINTKFSGNLTALFSAFHKTVKTVMLELQSKYLVNLNSRLILTYT